MRATRTANDFEHEQGDADMRNPYDQNQNPWLYSKWEQQYGGGYGGGCGYTPTYCTPVYNPCYTPCHVEYNHCAPKRRKRCAPRRRRRRICGWS